MLRLYEGEFSSVAREAVIEDIKRRVDKKERVYLVVPEQQTLLTELEMANILPSYAPLCFEVTNFPRLANTVFRVLGGISEGYCTKGVEALIMWRTLTELGPYLSTYTGKDEIKSVLSEKQRLEGYFGFGCSWKTLKDVFKASEFYRLCLPQRPFAYLLVCCTNTDEVVVAFYKAIRDSDFDSSRSDSFLLPSRSLSSRQSPCWHSAASCTARAATRRPLGSLPDPRPPRTGSSPIPGISTACNTGCSGSDPCILGGACRYAAACELRRADAAGSSDRRTYTSCVRSRLPQKIDQPGHISEELGRRPRDDESGTRLEALHAQTLQMLVDGGLEQVDEPLVRVERVVSVQMLRIAPTEGFATARGRA